MNFPSFPRITKSEFICETCDAGPFGNYVIGSMELKIKDFHEKQGHIIKLYSDDDEK